MTAMARSSRADRAAARQCRAGDRGVQEDHDRGAQGRVGAGAPDAEVAVTAAGPPDPRSDTDDAKGLAIGDLADPTAHTTRGPVLVEPRTKAAAALFHGKTVSASTPSGGSRQAGTVPAIMGDPHRSRSVIRPGWTVQLESRWHVRHCLRRSLVFRRWAAATSPSSHADTGATSRAAQGLPRRTRVAATTSFRTPRRAGRCPLRTPPAVSTPRGTLAAITRSRGAHRWRSRW